MVEESPVAGAEEPPRPRRCWGRPVPRERDAIRLHTHTQRASSESETETRTLHRSPATPSIHRFLIPSITIHYRNHQHYTLSN